MAKQFVVDRTEIVRYWLDEENDGVDTVEDAENKVLEFPEECRRSEVQSQGADGCLYETDAKLGPVDDEPAEETGDGCGPINYAAEAVDLVRQASRIMDGTSGPSNKGIWLERAQDLLARIDADPNV